MHWKKLLDWESRQWNALAFLLKTVSSLIFNKLIASTFGPEGLSLQAHAVNLLNLISGIARDGLARGMVNEMPHLPFRAKLAYLRHSLLFAAIAALCICLALHAHIAALFQWPWAAPIFAAAAIGYACAFVLASFHQAGLDFKKYAIGSSVGSLLGTALLALAVSTSQTRDFALLALPMGLASACLFFIPLLKSRALWAGMPSAAGMGRQAGYALLAVGSLIFGFGTEYAAREWSIEKLGLAETGLWQAGSTLSQYYTAAFTVVALAVYYPKLSNYFAQAPEKAIPYLKETLLWMLPTIWIGLGLLFILLPWLLRFMFGEAFLPVHGFASIQLLADAIRLPNYLLYYWLLARGHKSSFLGVQAISGIAYLAISIIEAESMQGMAFPLARLYSSLLATPLLLFFLIWAQKKPRM